jgi:hypothetical protein
MGGQVINMLDEAHDRIRELEAACEEYRSEFISPMRS